jgi:hypothetical protein
MHGLYSRWRKERVRERAELGVRELHPARPHWKSGEIAGRGDEPGATEIGPGSIQLIKLSSEGRRRDGSGGRAQAERKDVAEEGWVGRSDTLERGLSLCDVIAEDRVEAMGGDVEMQRHWRRRESCRGEWRGVDSVHGLVAEGVGIEEEPGGELRDRREVEPPAAFEGELRKKCNGRN